MHGLIAVPDGVTDLQFLVLLVVEQNREAIVRDHAPHNFSHAREKFVQIEGFGNRAHFQQEVEQFAAFLEPYALFDAWRGHVRPRRLRLPEQLRRRNWYRFGWHRQPPWLADFPVTERRRKPSRPAADQSSAA